MKKLFLSIIDSFLMVMPVSSSRADSAPTVSLPLSKSIAARVLVALFWSGGCLDCVDIPDCDDSRELRAALVKLQTQLDVASCGMEYDGRFDLGLGGTSLRFFLPVVASLPGFISDVDCEEALRRRPIATLVDALKRLGAYIGCRGEAGCRPPFLVFGRVLSGGELMIDASVSSQFVSALMLSAPMWNEGLNLTYEAGRSVSTPYLSMTAEVMRRFGVDVNMSEFGVTVPSGGYHPGAAMDIEADWSAASYFYEWLLARGAGEVRISSLMAPDHSLQGDSVCASLMEEVGILTQWIDDGSALLTVDMERLKTARSGSGVCWNLEKSPDLVPALAVGLCMAGIQFRFEGVAHLRHKESDRMNALVAELGKLGFRIIPGESTMSWHGERIERGDALVEIVTYGDHRMAMAFGVVASLCQGVSIENPGVVSKSFADFWNQLDKLP